MSEHYSTEKGPPALPDSDLFEPTLQSAPPAARGRRKSPWRVASQMWVAFFGGALALTVIAYLNGERLRLNSRQHRNVLLAGAAGIIITFCAAFALGRADVAELWKPGEPATGFRIVSRGIALITYLVVARFQRSAERIYRFGHGEYESLWVPGFLAVMVLGTIQNVLSLVLAQ